MRYLRLFAAQCKLSIMSAAMYRANFWLMLIQSLVNSVMGVLCVQFIYGSVDSIAGWNRREMIVLITTSQLVNQLFRGVAHFNQNRFIAGIGSGGFDRMLLRPVSLLFQTSTGQVDISCVFSAIGPLVIMIAQLAALGVSVSFSAVALYVVFVINGAVILSAFMLALYASAFWFTKVDGLANVYYLLMDIADKPKEMFARQFMYGFVFLIPAIPLANAPASMLLGRGDIALAAAYLAVGVGFTLLAYWLVRMGLARYTSASS